MFEDLIRFIRQWYGTDSSISLHTPSFTGREREYVLNAIDSTFVSSIGEYVNRFEQDLASFVGVGWAVATVNGTTALQMALRLAGVKPKEEVITQPLTFVATANAIVHTDAIPVFVDVDKDTMGMSPAALCSFLDDNVEKREHGAYNTKTGRRIAALVPMHTCGHPCRMEALLELANSWGIAVVEDAAEALGSKRNGKHCGTFGKLAIFSFNGNKTITCGGGGAIVTDDETLARRAKHLTTTARLEHSWEYIHDEVGYNFRMPNLNAAMACAQLECLNTFLDDKRLLAQAYEEFFTTANWGELIRDPKGCRSNYWLNTVITSSESQRDLLLNETNSAGVMTRPLWRLISELNMYRHCQTGPLVNARWLQQRAVNLPSSARHHE